MILIYMEVGGFGRTKRKAIAYLISGNNVVEASTILM